MKYENVKVLFLGEILKLGSHNRYATTFNCLYLWPQLSDLWVMLKAD